MKILYLIPYNPVPPTFGGAIRIYHILGSLVRNHEVTVAGFGKREEQKRLVKVFPELEGRVHFVHRPRGTVYNIKTLLYSLFSGYSHWYCKDRTAEMESLLDRIVSKKDFDLIHSEFPVLAGYDLDSDAVRIFDAHNVEYDNFRRMADGEINPFRKIYYWLESKKFYREEMTTAARQDAVLVTSRRDAVLFDADVPATPKYLIPNGVDLDYFQPEKGGEEPFSMVFVGMMKYLPNEDAMNFFLDDILPKITDRIPEAKIYIVGGKPGSSLLARQSKHVEVTGFVDDVRPYINRSSVYVVPLRMGGGTRLKILEAMAMQKPVVTTGIGCEGLRLKNGETALIADEPRKFADAVVRLMQERELVSRLSIQAYDLVSRKFSWDIVGSQLEEAYSKVWEKKFPNKKFPRYESEFEFDTEKLNKEML